MKTLCACTYPHSQDQTNLILQRQILACENVSGKFKHSQVNVMKNVLQRTYYNLQSLTARTSNQSIQKLYWEFNIGDFENFEILREKILRT